MPGTGDFQALKRERGQGAKIKQEQFHGIRGSISDVILATSSVGALVLGCVV